MEQWIITTAIMLGIGIITYFLKRTMNKVDEVEKTAEGSVTKADAKDAEKSLKSEIKEIRDSYTPKDVHQKDYDEVKADVKNIKAEYLPKEDFVREIGKMETRFDRHERKLDQILQILIERTTSKGQ